MGFIPSPLARAGVPDLRRGDVVQTKIGEPRLAVLLRRKAKDWCDVFWIDHREVGSVMFDLLEEPNPLLALAVQDEIDELLRLAVR